MAKAGYNPESALELWGLLNMLEEESHDDGNLTAERVLPFSVLILKGTSD